MNDLRVEFYSDATGDIRWRVKAPNGNILADGGQGYSRMIDARRGLELVLGIETVTTRQYGKPTRIIQSSFHAGAERTVEIVDLRGNDE